MPAQWGAAQRIAEAMNCNAQLPPGRTERIRAGAMQRHAAAVQRDDQRCRAVP